jgi:hypothetical protein
LSIDGGVDIFCLQNPIAQEVSLPSSSAVELLISVEPALVQILASVTINQSDAFNYPIKQIKCVLIKPVGATSFPGLLEVAVGGSGSHV